MTGYYNDVQASLFYLVKVFRDEAVDISPAMQSFKFDAHVENKVLPAADLIGPAGFSLIDNGGLVTINTQFLISTLDDTNNFRLDNLIDALYPKLIPGRTFAIVHHKTGNPLGQFTVADGTTIFPVERADNRPLKAISAQLKLDRASTMTPQSYWDALATWDASLLWN